MEKQKKEKSPKEIDCSRCSHKCTDYIDEDTRRKICEAFWSLNYSRQKDFILANVKMTVPKRRRPSTKEKDVIKRTNTKIFSLCDQRVCQSFFLSTLAISNGPLNNAFKHKSDFANFFTGDDKRGKHPPKNKLKSDLVNDVIAFLDANCFMPNNVKSRKKLIMVSHHRSLQSLYKTYKNQSEECPSYTSFKKIFHENNFSFPHEKIINNPPPNDPLKVDKVEIQSMEVINYVPEEIEEAEIEMLNLPSTSTQIENSSDVTELPDSTTEGQQSTTEVFEIQFVTL